MGNHVAVVPPVRPSELLALVLAWCAHPTTLVICSASDDFVRRCVEADDADDGGSTLPTASLLEVAVARHIRVAFVPTVAHLRGFLGAFDLAASRVAPPPDVSSGSGGANADSATHTTDTPTLLVYGFLQLHRDTSEWSAQGLSASAALLVEAGWRTGLDAVLMEDRRPEAGDRGEGGTLYDETIPVLSTAMRRRMQRAGYPLHTGRVRAVLQQWFEFRQHAWGRDEGRDEAGETLQKEEQVDDEALEREGGQDEPVEEVQEKSPPPPPPPKTYVKDSEDDDDLSDDEVYPLDETT